MRKFVLVSGKAGAGKDTVARILSEKHGFKDYRYADSLKEVLLHAGWDGRKDLRGRKLLQDVGRAFRRWDVNFWVDKLIRSVADDIGKGYDKFCIADVRHRNELFYFRNEVEKLAPDSEFVHVRVVGVLDLLKLREMDEETLGDVSETELDGVAPDYLIHNTVVGSYEFLEVQLDSLVKEILSD